MHFSRSLRPRASSGSSQSERTPRPLVLNSTQSLDMMPRFAISAEEEGKPGKTFRSPVIFKPRRTRCLTLRLLCVSRRYGLQSAANSSPQQQHRHQAVIPQRRVQTHCSPTGHPRKTEAASWKSPQVCLSLWTLTHYYPRCTQNYHL